MKNKKIHTPTPLFDTLEQTTLLPLSTLLTQVELPNTVSDAEQDLTFTFQFLYNYRGNEATFNAYRRELERFLHWSWLVAKKSVTSLKNNHIEEFIEFCQKPPKTWIGESQEKRFLIKQGKRVPNTKWRPFVIHLSKKSRYHNIEVDISRYALSQNALQAIFSILNSYYNYLVQNNYAAVNPVAQIRQKSKYLRKQTSQQIVRRLSDLQWAYVIETAEQMAVANPLEHERTLFIMSALYGMYLRVSELVANARWIPKMGDFFQDSDGNWWFTTVGKGNKQRQISVSNNMLAALKRYRSHLNLPAFPQIAEVTPLINKTRGQGPISSTRQIRNIVQDCFNIAINRLGTDGFLDDADRLQSATVHWLRHTGISDDVKIRPREHVRDDAGHSSSGITDRYIDVELRQRHASAKNKLIKPVE